MMDQLVGKRLDRFSLNEPGFDLDLYFEDLRLRVFCDQVNEREGIDNYSLFLPSRVITVETKSRITIEASARS